MIKVAVILGTRPEAIKLAPVILGMKSDPLFECSVCVTAQHRELLDQALAVFGIVPDTDLDLMEYDQGLNGFTAKAIPRIDSYLANRRPDLVIVQGDTTTVLCTALASFYRRIPLAHIEAGLRTGDLYSPWPEEANRTLVSHIAALNFAPTETNRNNLLREGISPERIFVTGNTVIDALNIVLNRVGDNPPTIPGRNPSEWRRWEDSTMILITGHRRENFGFKMESICCSIKELALRFPRAHFLFSVHLNPHVRGPVYEILGASKHDNIHLIEPVPYDAFVALMDRSTLILTDSGGIQEEATSLGKPTLVLRDNSERPEALATRTVKLIGTDQAVIINEVTQLLTDSKTYKRMSKKHGTFGDGQAFKRILRICLNELERRTAVP